MRETWVVDFETAAIEDRPHYPPKPVGVALGRLTRGRVVRPRYHAWAHPSKNNSTLTEGKRALAALWRDPEIELVFHNAKFDLDVAEVHLGLKPPTWDRVHDTLFQIYLDDPRAASLSLKPAAQRLLQLPPAERDAVRDWLVEAKVVRRGDAIWGAHISKAPGDLVGKYAIGDIERTGRLHYLLHPRLVKRKMLGAYDRERQLMPILLANERAGVRVDLERLTADVRLYDAALERCDGWLRRRLGVKDLDLDKDAQLADALDGAKLVDVWAKTPTGKRSTSKKNLTLNDPLVQNALSYRAQLATCLRTFMRSWLAQAQGSGGLIYTNWNQVRGDNDKGTRTGRLSSNPNKQNIPNEFKELKLPLKLPALPRCRMYIVGDDKSHVILSADYSQQELRALAHFEDGPLQQLYLKEPRLDLHDRAGRLINEMLNLGYDEARLKTFRKPIKNLGFGLIYGMGKDKTAATMGLDLETAMRIKAAYLTIFPGLKSLNDDLKRRARLGQPIRTWGGREYYCEVPKMIRDPETKLDKLRTFEYKMLNLLIQGSSADCTKEAMIRYDASRSHGRFMLQVHDQLLVSVPRQHVQKEARALRKAMESIEFDVPMLIDLSVGSNWNELESLKVKP